VRLAVLAELRRRNFLEDGADDEADSAATRPDPTPSQEPDPEALKIWRSARAVPPDHEVTKFLAARGLVGPVPPSLRAGSVLHLEQHPFPAMVAAVQAPERQIIAVQTTLIDPRGYRKAQIRVPRKTVGALGWGAVRLAAAGEALGLAEGTEKGLAAMQLFQVPCWSTLGGGRMHRVWVPPSVRELFIFADNDDCGRAAVERTAHAHRHRRVIIKFPPDGFKDWDDVAAQQARERGAA
jgi:putative DNA primase/helicase